MELNQNDPVMVARRGQPPLVGRVHKTTSMTVWIRLRREDGRTKFYVADPKRVTKLKEEDVANL